MSLLPNSYVNRLVAKSTFMSPEELRKAAARTNGKAVGIYSNGSIRVTPEGGKYASSVSANKPATPNEPKAPERSLDDYLGDFMDRFNSLPEDYRNQAVQDIKYSYEDNAYQDFVSAFDSIPDQYKRDALSALGGFGNY